jgi:LmbE family N-acetylglucosaminyl deacetylase
MVTTTIAGFLAHHRQTVAPVSIACMSDAEFEEAIADAAKLLPADADAAAVYDIAMLRLKAGIGVPETADDFASLCRGQE